MTLVVAALSARALCEATRAEGLEVLAVDAFGDRDTRRLARRWWPAGAGRLEPGVLLASLRAARDEGGATHCIAGSGFEGQPALLAAVAELLPLTGTAPAARAAVDDAATFFRALDDAGIAHPPVRFDPPPLPEGWLVKRPGAGGLQVRRARAGDLDVAGGCWQLERRGAPVGSATLVADGERARLWGLNRQWTDGDTRHPFRFGGVAGPIDEPRLAAELQAIADALVPRLALRGLVGIDFLQHAGRVEVLEVNARPPASAAAYPGALRAHLAAHGGHLLAPPPPTTVRGMAVVYAREAGIIDERLADTIAQGPGMHDWPQPGTRLAAGDPLCSLSAAAPTFDAVRHLLAQRRDTLLALMENAEHE